MRKIFFVKLKRNPGSFTPKTAKIAGYSGGPARAAALSPERRQEIARAAALARWGLRSSDKG